VTIFWWKYDNKVYVIGEENKNWTIYELIADFKNIKIYFQLIVSLKTVLNFISIRLIDNKTFYYRIKRLKNSLAALDHRLLQPLLTQTVVLKQVLKEVQEQQ